MATTIATAVVEVKIDRKYQRELDKLQADIKTASSKAASTFHKNFSAGATAIVRLSKNISAALKPIEAALGGVGALSIKKALEQNAQLSERWRQSTNRINNALGGVGEKILKASFAGKTMFEWMDKFAESLRNLTEKDVQKLVNSFLIIGGVLASLKAISIGGNLAKGIENAAYRSGISSGVGAGGGSLLGEGVGGLLSYLGYKRLSSQFSKSQEGMLEKVFSLRGGGPSGLLMGKTTEEMAMKAGVIPSPSNLKGIIGKGGAYGALFIAITAAVASAWSIFRGNWDEHQGAIKNITGQISSWGGSALNAYSNWVKFIFGKISDAIEWRMQWISDFAKDVEAAIRSWASIVADKTFNLFGKTGPGAQSFEQIRAKMEPSLGPVGPSAKPETEEQIYNRRFMEQSDPLYYTMKRMQQSSQDAIAASMLKEAQKEKYNAKVLRDIDEVSAIRKRRQEERDLRKDIADKKNELDDMEVEYLNGQIDLKEVMSEKFKGKPGTIGFYSAEESYRAATGWQAELLQYEKEKKEFEKEKAKKQQSMIERLLEIKGNGDKLAKIFEDLKGEALQYNN